MPPKEKQKRKKRSDAGKSRKGKSRKGGKRRSSRRGFKIPMPSMADVKAAAILFAGDVFDKAVYALPEKLNPWAAAAFAGGVQQKDADVIRMGYRIQLAHLAKTTPSGNPATDRVAEKVRSILGSKSRGRDALGPGSTSGTMSESDREEFAEMFKNATWPGKE